MSHDYKKTRDTSEEIVYSKTHRNRDRTRVGAGYDPETGKWHITATDTGGGSPVGATIGTAATKKEAKQKLRRWIRSHPKGVDPVGLGMPTDVGQMPDLAPDGLPEHSDVGSRGTKKRRKKRKKKAGTRRRKKRRDSARVGLPVNDDYSLDMPEEPMPEFVGNAPEDSGVGLPVDEFGNIEFDPEGSIPEWEEPELPDWLK